ncbi:MAG TPA: glycerol-3-phosphate 1-O-acyltransferase PlsY [Vicinamibacterales bacterium]|jgi:glycerol-3-phosphate acyltransferase PlsY|nr:glycerol-3-phosphate 1-O-acyltransferase PlsY [Vicinamibacterales bacterium]
MEFVTTITLAYLVGSVPFAYLLSRRRGIDLRLVGSGNIGATNVLRTSGVRTAVLAVGLDAIKGLAAVAMARRFATGSAVPVVAGVASIVGHVYPVWLRFKGGKGVATAAGVFVMLTPVALAIASGVFVITVWITRYISVGSIVGAVTLAIVAFASDASGAIESGSAIVAAIILYRHRANIGRLWAGTERRVGQRLFT